MMVRLNVAVCRFGLVLFFSALAAGTVHAADTGVQRMYVLNCGESRTNDVSMWSPRKLPRPVDSSKLEFPRRAIARGNALAAGFPAHRAV